MNGLAFVNLEQACLSVTERKCINVFFVGQDLFYSIHCIYNVTGSIVELAYDMGLYKGMVLDTYAADLCIYHYYHPG